MSANTLFNKVLGENEKFVFYFCLKTEGNFGVTHYINAFITMHLICLHEVYKYRDFYIYSYMWWDDIQSYIDNTLHN